MIELLNSILPKKSPAVKPQLTHPRYRLILKDGFMKQIMQLKGWKTYEAAGQALGFTRAYIQMIDKTKVQVGPEFITSLAACLGNTKEGWHIPFEIVPHGVADENHPVWNQLKHDGKVPYRRYSPAGEARKKDYAVEIKNT